MGLRRWLAPLALLVALVVIQGCASPPPGGPPPLNVRQGVVMIFKVEPEKRELIAAYVHDPVIAHRTWWVLRGDQDALPTPPVKTDTVPHADSSMYLKYVLVSDTSPAQFQNPGRLPDHELVQWLCKELLAAYQPTWPLSDSKVWVIDEDGGLSFCSGTPGPQ